jgi:rSAM/selenodomain-associated transferase 2
LISIITPLINEEAYVRPFLDNLRNLDGSFELIIVDGGSSDGTLDEVKKNITQFDNKVKLLRASAGRTVQMNRGAEEASGKILLFLHVDCLIPKDSLNVIETRILNGGVIGGAFKQVFSNQDLFLRIVSVFGNLRSRLTGTFFGDYGIFLMKDLFRRIGGYDDVLFLEDVELCRKARQYGKLTQIDRYIFTSSRKYLSEGKVRLTIIFILVCLLNLLKCRPRFFVRYMA